MQKKLNPVLNDLSLTFTASVFLLLSGLSLLLYATDMGRSFTTEGFRRHQIQIKADPVVNLALTDSEGQNLYLKDAIQRDGRFVVLDFFYTSCVTICTAQASAFELLQQRIKQANLEKKVRLISISFDPVRDDANTLTAYAKNIGADPLIWSLMTLQNPKDLKTLLDGFGIYVVNSSPYADLEHNASLHLIKPGGDLIKITALDEIDELYLALQKELSGVKI